MIYAVIQPGTNTVSNIIVADANFIALHYPGAIRIDTLMPMPGIGWRHSNGSFIAPRG